MLSRHVKLIGRLAKLTKATPRQLGFYSNKPMSFRFSTEKMEFKAETKRLLDIVAKSLYTDS